MFSRVSVVSAFALALLLAPFLYRLPGSRTGDRPPPGIRCPAKRAGRVHGEGARPARAQPEGPQRLRARRAGNVRDPRPGRVPLHRTNREYTWFVRDGMHVRSPVRFGGVPVGDEARVEYEDLAAPRAGPEERKKKEEAEKGWQDARARRGGHRQRVGYLDMPSPPSRGSCPKPTSWTSSSSRGTTTSPGARSSTARRS